LLVVTAVVTTYFCVNYCFGQLLLAYTTQKFQLLAVAVAVAVADLEIILHV
jgi:hypothetical protein